MTSKEFLEEDKVLVLPIHIGLQEKLIRIGTIGDGSCFFHSVCLAIDEHPLWKNSYVNADRAERQAITRSLRRTLSDSVTEDKLKMIFSEATNSIEHPSLEEFKQKLADPKEWANEPIIRYTSKQLNKNIIFLNLTSNAPFCNVHHPEIMRNIHCTTCDALETILVAWVKNQHFELIGILQNIDTKYLYIESLIKDPKVIKIIMEEYFKQCKLKL